jgi:hypothetical protein
LLKIDPHDHLSEWEEKQMQAYDHQKRVVFPKSSKAYFCTQRERVQQSKNSWRNNKPVRGVLQE